MYTCQYCGRILMSKSGLIVHERFCVKNPNRIQTTPPKTKYTFKCAKCGREYILYLSDFEYRLNRYSKHCSRSCANARTHSDETKIKISKTLYKNCCSKVDSWSSKKKQVFDTAKYRTCKCCGKQYIWRSNISDGSTKNMCSKHCSIYYREHLRDFLSEETLKKFSEIGRKNCIKQSNLRRSKGEEYFCELCKAKYDNVLSNKLMFNGWDADIILPDYKVAILYNGPWHYKQISKSVSLAQIQNRDKIKIKEIENCGYIPYIVKDMGKFNKKFVEEQFIKFTQYMDDNITNKKGVTIG